MHNLKFSSLKRSGNSTIAERNSRTKSKRNLTSAIKYTTRCKFRMFYNFSRKKGKQFALCQDKYILSLSNIAT